MFNDLTFKLSTKTCCSNKKIIIFCFFKRRTKKYSEFVWWNKDKHKRKKIIILFRSIFPSAGSRTAYGSVYICTLFDYCCRKRKHRRWNKNIPQICFMLYVWVWVWVDVYTHINISLCLGQTQARRRKWKKYISVVKNGKLEKNLKNFHNNLNKT